MQVWNCRGSPTTNKTATVWNVTKIWSRVPEGLNAKTDGLTDTHLPSRTK